MLYFHQIVFCLLFMTNFLFTAHRENQDNNYATQEKKSVPASQDHIKTDPVSPTLTPDDIRKKISERILQQFEQKEKFSKNEIEEMEMVLEAAPLKAQLIPQHLENPDILPGCEDFRSAYFIGAPGTGKTIAAKAIAYKMSQKGWNYKFISSTKLVEGYRNQTSIRIENELEHLMASGKPTIIIIDEISRLLEYADKENHDTGMSATAIWSFLDRQLRNPNFFLIGTMNSAEKLPEPFKNRIMSQSIQFEVNVNPELKIKHLRKRLTNKFCSLHEEVTDEFLKNELKKIDSCYGRSLIHLATLVVMQERINTNEPHLIITKKSITNGINEYLSNEKMLKLNVKIETDEERQERHHRENMIGNVVGNVASSIIVKILIEIFLRW